MTDGNSNRTDCERAFMAEALAVAARIERRPWPNPPVGAVVVKDGQVIGHGAHLGAGHPHAERVALEQAGTGALGATLYCTLEPCNHQGRTPPCAPAVANSGVDRVVIGVCDPNPTVSGGGIELLRAAGIDVTVGVAAAACLDLIWPFVVTDGFQRPYVELKSAASLDGRFSVPQRRDVGLPAGPAARPDGVGPVYLTGLAARGDVHLRRRWVDLVLVGEETARRDRPQLDGRLVTAENACPVAEPAAGYVDSDASYTGGLARENYFLFHGRSAVPQSPPPSWPVGARPVACAMQDGHVDPRDLLQRAADLGIATVMLEGGPRLASAFLAADLIDRWVHYIAPVVLGAGARWPDASIFGDSDRSDPLALTLTSYDRFGADLRTIHDRCDFAAMLRKVTAERAATASVTLAAESTSSTTLTSAPAGREG